MKIEMEVPDGHRLPRIHHVPGPPVGTLGQEAIEVARLAGMELDPWQADFVIQSCSIDPAKSFHNPLTRRREYKWAQLENALVVPRQNGKCFAVSTPVYTSNRGWLTHADVRVGDMVYGSDGTPTAVIELGDTLTGEDCYRVTFTDSSSYVASGAHRWHVKGKASGWRDLSTEHLAARVGGVRPGNGRMEYNWRVRADTVVHTPEAELPVDPYLLGYWLGDGSTGKATVTVGADDASWTVARLRAAGAIETSRSYNDTGALSWSFRTTEKWSHHGFLADLRELGIFDGKRIPEAYLTASPDQRRALLAGLLDSDGSIATTRRASYVEFSTSIPALGEDFLRLVRSLGIKAAPRVSRSSLNGIRKKDRTRFNWTPTFNPFEMPRKRARYAPPASLRSELMSITSITRVETEPVRGFKVEAADSVYLVGHNFTPTHNSGAFEVRELAGLFLFGERLIIHSAHLAETSQEQFIRVKNLIEGVPDFDREVLKVREAHDGKGIYLKSGQRLLFKTRTSSGGRGLSADCIVFDEAMVLGEAVIGSVFPSLSARPNPHVFYGGSSGNIEVQDCVQLGRLQTRALQGDDPSLLYSEWSIDNCNEFCQPGCAEHDDPESWESWAKANPGFGHRVSPDHIAKEMRAMGGPRSRKFLVERLGVGYYPIEGQAWKVIPKGAWEMRRDDHSQIDGPFALGVDVTPDMSYSALAVCGKRAGEDGLMHVEIPGNDAYELPIDHRPGVQWLIPRILEIWKNQKPGCVVIDAAGHAAGLIEELERAKVKVIKLNGREYAQSCGEFRSAVCPQQGEEARLVHIGQPSLTSALAEADKRDLLDLWAWSRRTSAGDISPLVASTLAMHGYKHSMTKKAVELSFAWA